jgi:hypothetical protein
MFLSYSWEHWVYTVVDSDFVEDLRSEYLNPERGFIERLIEMYEKKGIPVKLNLIKALVAFAKRNNQDIRYTFACHKNDKKFAEYADDIEKLMVLM